MKTVGRILTIIMVLAASSRVHAELTGPGTYRGYYNETRWGDRVLHLGPYHTFVSEAAAKALLEHKGKPLEVEVTDLSQPPLGRGMIQAVGKVKEDGSHKGLRIKAVLESKRVERGDGVKINIALSNSTDKDITIDSAKLAVVLAANSPKSQNKIDYKDPDGRSYWYYRYYYLTSGDEAGPSGIACHQTLLRWSDKQFSGIEVDPARNRVTKGDRITVEANGTFTASYTAAKELPEGEYELFVYLVSGNLSAVPGPMSARLAFDVVDGDNKLIQQGEKSSAHADKREGDRSGTQPNKATSLTRFLDNSNFTLVSSETSLFSFSPVNSNIIYCGRKGIMSMDCEKRQSKTLLESPEPGDYIWAWMSPDGKLLLVLSRKGKLVLVNVGTGKKTPLKEELPRGFKGCAFAPGGTYFVAIGGMEDSELLYWELAPGEGSVRSQGKSTLADCCTLYDCAFSPDGNIFATVSGSGLVDSWSAPPMKPVRKGTSVARNGGLSGIAFSSNGEVIAAAAAFEPIIALIDSATGEVVKRIDWKRGHALSKRRLTFLPRSRVVASADGDKIGFLDTDSGRSLGSVPAGGIVRSLKCSPDGRWLVAGTRKKSLVLWRLKE